jgi:6-phosphogluconolactonase
MPRPATLSLHISADPAAVALEAAELFTGAAAAAVTARGVARIAISGGSTPKAMFALLADPSQDFHNRIDWARLQLYWVDERSVPPTDPESNYHMTDLALLSKVPLPAPNVHRMEGELDPAIAAARYESQLRNSFRLEGAETPTFDLILLGMGDDGHTASLFPHTAALDNITDLVIANHVPQKDTWRITLTWPVINQGRQVVFVIAGPEKAEVLAKVLLGPYHPEILPSQLIRPANRSLTMLLDSAAAQQLPGGGSPGTRTLELV